MDATHQSDTRAADKAHLAAEAVHIAAVRAAEAQLAMLEAQLATLDEQLAAQDARLAARQRDLDDAQRQGHSTLIRNAAHALDQARWERDALKAQRDALAMKVARLEGAPPASITTPPPPAAPPPPDAPRDDGAGEVKIVLRDRPPGATETTQVPPSSTASVSGSAPPHAGNSALPEIRRALGVLCEPGALYELRMLGADGAGIKAGFFDDLDALAATAAEYDGRAKGIYVTLNPVNPELLTRHRHPRNALAATVRDALTSKADVPRRRWMLLDFDPERPRGSATDDEKAAARERAEVCRWWLVEELGFAPESIVAADSGNGAHLLLRVELPNDDASESLVRQCLDAVAVRFTDAAVKLDTSVFDANRITKLYGTLARKGKDTAEHPHRRSALGPALVPSVGEGRSLEHEPAPRAVLERLAASLPADGALDAEQPADFNLAAWIAEHKLPLVLEGVWTGKGGKGRKFLLNPCPFNPEHDNRSAVILEHASGAISFRCLHDSCRGNDWRALRDKLEPGWRERSAGSAAAATNGARLPKRPRTDCGNAERVVDLHGTDLRYCHTWRTWLVWDGRRWKLDETGEEVRRAKATVRQMRAEAKTLPKGERRTELLRYARACEAASRIGAMAKLAQSDSRVVVTPDQLDADPWLLNVENGTLDLRTGELRDARREDYLTKVAPVAYDSTAECPHWLAFLDSTFAGDKDLIDFVQRAVGYSLTGDVRERCIFILHGGGRNGKSTFLELLLALLGDDYGLKARSAMLLVKRENAIPHDIAELKGRRFVAASEVDEGKRLAEAAVKEMSGDDTLRGRFLYQGSFSFRPECKLWLGTNHKPDIRGSDDAIWDRIKLLPFNVRFVDPDNDKDAPPKAPRADKTLRAKLLAELPAILRWAVEGCLAWQRDGLGTARAIAKANAEYRAEMDHFQDYLDERCQCEAGSCVRTSELYADYMAWCTQTAAPLLTRQMITSRLDERGFTPDKRNGHRVRLGIALRGASVVELKS